MIDQTILKFDLITVIVFNLISVVQNWKNQIILIKKSNKVVLFLQLLRKQKNNYLIFEDDQTTCSIFNFNSSESS